MDEWKKQTVIVSGFEGPPGVGKQVLQKGLAHCLKMMMILIVHFLYCYRYSSNGSFTRS